MAKLPTEKQLAKLYYDKGHGALVWYAWRNALRALPVLGLGPPRALRIIWKKNTVRQVYLICRTQLLLAQWCDSPKKVSFPLIAKTTKIMADVVAAIELAADTTSTISPSASSFATDANAYAAAADAFNAANYASNSFMNPANSDDIAAANAVAAMAAADYALLQKTETVDHSFWLKQPLWPDGLSSQPEQFRVGSKRLIEALDDLGLGFIADDLNDLWNGYNLKSHTKNYFNEYSDVEVNNTDTLRQLILGEEDADQIHAVRVLLLGPGGAGKSSLADRLQGNTVEKVKCVTPGVNYQHHQPLNLRKTFPNYRLVHKQLDLFLWDFGGQTIFHGLHRAFLHENCVYILVVDSRHEQAPDDWLHQIRHLAGSQTKVLLVTNQYEECKTPQNETRLLREFSDLLSVESFFYFSCLDCVNDMEVDFQRFVMQLIQNSLQSQKMVLKETLDVQKALQKRYQEKNDVFLELDDLEEVIEATTSKADIAEEMSEKLQQLGFIVKVDHFETSYCLKPEWAIDHSYELIYSKALRNSNGLMTFKSLGQCFEKRLKTRHMKHLIDFLQERSLCHKLSSSDEFFFPDAAKANEPELVSHVMKDEKALVLRFDMPYLPLGFHAHLVHNLFVINAEVGIQSQSDIWRQGFILRKGSSQAVVQYLLRKNIIEMVLLGQLKDFSELLNVFILNLKAAITNSNDNQPQDVSPSVILNEQSFSVHSSEALIKVLSKIENYDELINEVSEMASKIIVGAHSQVAINAQGVTQKYQSDNQTLEINTDQRRQIAEIVTELLKDVSAYPTDQLSAVVKVKSALEYESPENNNLLGRVWAGLSEITDFTNNAIGVGQFVVKHQAAITAAIAATTSVIG